ncbi:MAG: acetyl-CoA carboxylase biotin carboxyl carrier protein [Pseudonocardiaceae bacterium]
MIDNEMTDLPADLIGQPSSVEMATRLEVVRDNVLQLLSGFPHPPSVLRVNAGNVTVEAEWPVAASDVAAAAVASSAAAVDSPVAAAPADNRQVVCSPSVGVFYTAPEPGARPFVEPGATIMVGQQIGIVEAMKLMIPVKADGNGVVDEILKGDSEPVEYGEPLFAYHLH